MKKFKMNLSDRNRSEAYTREEGIICEYGPLLDNLLDYAATDAERATRVDVYAVCEDEALLKRLGKSMFEQRLQVQGKGKRKKTVTVHYFTEAQFVAAGGE